MLLIRINLKPSVSGNTSGRKDKRGMKVMKVMKVMKEAVQSFVLIFFMIGILSLCTANMVLAQAGGSVAGEDLIDEINTLDRDLQELSERLDEVETKTLIDKISIGAEMRTRFDWYHFEDNDLDDRDSVNLLPSNRFRLNLKADVSENIKFHSRLVVYKNWMDDSMTTTMDMYAARTPTDTTVKAERAYVDYFFKGLPLALTFGRLPFTDGLPTDLKENTTRKSTYPSLAYDVEGDGIALSYGLKDLIHLPDSAARLIYLKMLIRDDDAELWEDDALGIDDQNIYLFQFETGFPGA